MDMARLWLRSVVVATLLISVAQSLMPEGSVRKIGAFAGGLVLVAALLQPFQRGRDSLPELDIGRYEAEIAARREALREASERALREDVAERVSRLITARAADRGLTLSAAVAVHMEGAVPVPWEASLSGGYDAALSAWMEAELGIPPERQRWTETGN